MNLLAESSRFTVLHMPQARHDSGQLPRAAPQDSSPSSPSTAWWHTGGAGPGSFHRQSLGGASMPPAGADGKPLCLHSGPSPQTPPPPRPCLVMHMALIPVGSETPGCCLGPQASCSCSRVGRATPHHAPLASTAVPVRGSPRQPLRAHERAPPRGWCHQRLLTEHRTPARLQMRQLTPRTGVRPAPRSWPPGGLRACAGTDAHTCDGDGDWTPGSGSRAQEAGAPPPLPSRTGNKLSLSSHCPFPQSTRPAIPWRAGLGAGPG